MHRTTVPLVDAHAVARGQAGVVTRSQAVSAGMTDAGICAQLVAQRWQRIHPGIYACFTGTIPWASKVWAAVLWCGEGAAIGGETALRLSGMQMPDDHVVHVCVDHRRRVSKVEGIRVHRVVGLRNRVHPVHSPPRLRLEDAVLHTASRRSTLDQAIGVVADAVQQRLTTPERLRWSLAGWSRLRRRRELRLLLDDVAAGAYSYLEVRFLRDVERPHGLPTGSRQRRVRAGRSIWFRDVEYVGLDVIAELDGRLGHETFGDRAQDMDRDNAATRSGAETYRLGYSQVLAGSCDAALLIGEALLANGWGGQLTPCGVDCPAHRQPGRFGELREGPGPDRLPRTG